MRIPLDRHSMIPLYQQIETYLRQGILSGSLAANTRLPASRQLARDLGVNRITVENAYAVLETDGLIYSRMGSGTYVLSPDPLLVISRDKPGATWPLWQVRGVTPGPPAPPPGVPSPPSGPPGPSPLDAWPLISAVQPQSPRLAPSKPTKIPGSLRCCMGSAL